MQNRNLFAVLVFACVLTLTWVAAAQSASTNSQPQPGVENSSPVQNPSTGASAPASPATPQPGQAGPGAQSGSPQSQAGSTVQSPSGAPPSGSSSSSQAGSASTSQGQSGSQPRSVEDELQLTDAQKAKLQPIIQEEMGQIEAVRNDTSLSMDQKVAKVRQIKQTEFPKIQAVLTPEQQKKLADMQERARQNAAQGGSQSSTGAQGNSQPPKQ